jgi:hypothetical protein
MLDLHRERQTQAAGLKNNPLLYGNLHILFIFIAHKAYQRKTLRGQKTN